MARKKNNEGCFSVFIVFFIGMIAFSLLQSLFDFAPLFNLIIAGVIGILVMVRWLGIPSRKSLVTAGAILLFLFFVLKGFQYLIQLTGATLQAEQTTFDSVQEDWYVTATDSIAVFKSNHSWKDNYGSPYTATLQVRQSDFKSLKDYIESYRPASSKNFWGSLYKYMDHRDGPALDLVVEAFEEINNSKNLNQMEFAEMVVSCIQNIPYSFVFDKDCLPAHQYEDSIRHVLEQCPSCCIGNKAYGIQNPVSFLQNLKGDCDTRTVLIYSILKHFDYDVAIANSDFYRHSIIGLNLPASGDFKIYKAKKYFLWETTSKYFTIGELSTNFDDTNHWEIVLTSK